MIERYVGDTLYYVMDKQEFLLSCNWMFLGGFLLGVLVLASFIMFFTFMEKIIKNKKEYTDSLDDKNYRKYHEYLKKM